MLLAEPIQITHRIAQEFERLRIRYLVGRSLASSLHGIPRATNDVDMVAEMTEAHIPLDKDKFISAEFKLFTMLSGGVRKYCCQEG